MQMFVKLNALNVFMVKTIADDVYEELVRMKGNRSFSELLRELIREKRGYLNVVLKLAKAVDADKLERVSKDIEREFERWRDTNVIIALARDNKKVLEYLTTNHKNTTLWR